MSKRSKNSLLTLNSNRSTHQTAAIKDELLAMKYTLNGPDSSIYPYDDYTNAINTLNNELEGLNPYSLAIEEDDKFKHKSRSSMIRRTSFKSRSSPCIDEPGVGVSSTNANDGNLTYPDYKPWLDHTVLSPSESKLENEKITNNAYLNKGYFEPPLVSNEYYLARLLIQNTIFSSSSNCQRILQDLLDQLATTYKMRNEQVNRIKFESSTFKLPLRVTLTALKKEAWFRDLANPTIPLIALANRIPHGVRNKVLVESLCSKFVPIPRAIWFTKCVLQSELVAWRKKISLRLQQQQQQNQNQKLPSILALETQWLQEWTQQLVEYINKFSREMTSISSQDKKELYMQKLNYLLLYTQTLYIECLLDKPSFLSFVIRFLVDGFPVLTLNLFLDDFDNEDVEDNDDPEADNSQDDKKDNHVQQQRQQQMYDLQSSLNYGQRLVALTIIKTYWNDILKFDYLCKELCEGLLLSYFIIKKTPIKRAKTPHQHNMHISNVQQANSQNNVPGSGPFLTASSPAAPLTGGGFALSPIYANSPYFPMSTTPGASGGTTANLNHNQASSTATSSIYNTFSLDIKNKLLKNFGDLITFLVKVNANVFIIPNYWQLVGKELYNILQGSPTSSDEERLELDKQYRVIKYRNESLMLNLSGPTSSPSSTDSPIDYSASARYHKKRSQKDILNIIYLMDSLKLSDHLSNYLCPSSEDAGGSGWKQYLKVVLYWCTTCYRHWSYSKGEKILIVCNLLKKMIIPKIYSNIEQKAEFENEILEIIYDMADKNQDIVDPYRLYVLINELYQLKLFTISSYLRKLIASGIFYVNNSEDNTKNEGHQKLIDSHINILKNLPVLNNRQCDSILRKWTIEKNFDFQSKFDIGKEVILNTILPLLREHEVPSQNEVKIESLRMLPVGLNFLLVNWTTSQIKSIITNSSKLVHITPVILTKLYEFYSMCDCLTVFFNAILRFILKNDGMIIIYYMDTLRLISRLMLKHSKLVSLIEQPTNQVNGDDRGDLFRLVMYCYKDLLTREPDYFNFREYWKHMNMMLNKLNDLSEETAASPKFETHVRHSQSLTPEYIDNIENMLSFTRSLLGQEEILEIFVTLNLPETSLQDVSLHKLFQMLYESSQRKKERDYEVAIVRLLVQYKDFERDAFYSEFKIFSHANEFNLSFCQKLVMYDLIDISFFMNESESQKDDLDSGEEDEKLVWKILKDNYLSKKPLQTLDLILSGKLKPMPFLEQITRKYPEMALEQFLHKNSTEVVLTAYGELLGVDFSNSSQADILKLIASIANEFNLQMCQVLLSAIHNPDIPLMIDTFLSELDIKFCAHNSYFGEIFDYLNWENRLVVLETIESIFLTETKIEEDTISLQSRSGKNLLPVFKDIFKKFSMSNNSSDNLETLQYLLENFISFTSKLTNLTDKQDSSNDYDTDIYNTICIYLRILIIRKQSLVSLMNQFDSKFQLVKNLIDLLNSSYFSKPSSEKLRILLYDLLLLMKTSISELISDTTSNNAATDIPTTPGAGPITPAPNFHHLPQDSQMHRLSVSSGSGTNDLLTAEMFNIPEPTNENPLAKYLEGQQNKVEDLFTLDESEISRDSEIFYVNGNSLMVVDKELNTSSNFHLKSYDLLEDIGTGLNDGCINLLLFESYTTRQNPP